MPDSCMTTTCCHSEAKSWVALETLRPPSWRSGMLQTATSHRPQSLTSDQGRDLFGLTRGGTGRIRAELQGKPDTAAHSSGVASCHTQNDAPSARRPPAGAQELRDLRSAR